MDKLRDMIRSFAEARDWDQFHSPKNLAIALSVECSELLEHFTWLTQDESREIANETVSEEIGDIMIYLIGLCDKLGIDPLKAASMKLATNEIKYPVSLSKGNAQKYTELREGKIQNQQTS